MTLGSSLQARVRGAALVTATVAVVVATGATAATAAPRPDARTGSADQSLIDPAATPTATPSSARVAAASIPTSCTGVTFRTSNGGFTAYSYQGQRFTKHPIGQLSFGGVVETPKTMAYATHNSNGDEVFLAVRSNGSLWRVVSGDSGLTTSQVHASGWSGVRHIAGSWTGTRLYALTTSGGFYRYSLTADGTPRSLGPIATTGWSSIKFLTASSPDDTYDTVIGVSTAGALRQYAISRATGETFGGNLKASGWGQMTHISVGSCDTSGGAPIIGIHSSGTAYGYYDANAYDLYGGDIRGVGQMGYGFTGLMND